MTLDSLTVLDYDAPMAPDANREPEPRPVPLCPSGALVGGASLPDRFWDKVAYIGAGADECWLWRGATGGTGGVYGVINPTNKNRHIGAHRVSYMLHVGPIPEGYTIDHLCRVTLCVNPRHLESVTQQENILRGTGTSADNARKTHCPYGHPYDEENTRRWGKGRRCLQCAHRHFKTWYRKQRGSQL